MSAIGFFMSFFHRARRRRALAQVQRAGAPVEDALEDWSRSLRDPTGFYLDCHRWFLFRLPESLRAHRAFFRDGERGFGEDAFHVMWWLLFSRFRPREFGEIGVYRGQTLSLAALLQREEEIDGRVTGISPFDCSGDSVSRYRPQIDYYADTLENCAHFGLPSPALVRARSTDSLALEALRSHAWDCLYIDGNHEYEVARQDWENCAAAVSPEGIIVLDDAARGTGYRPPAFATAGHPGPSRVAEEIDPATFREILRVGHNRVFQKIA
jgi:hypothetical protein